jgi:hypothetical protein
MTRPLPKGLPNGSQRQARPARKFGQASARP